MEEEEGKGGHRRDILGNDGDATTVPIRHLPRERPTGATRGSTATPRRLLACPRARARARSLFYIIKMQTENKRREETIDDNLVRANDTPLRSRYRYVSSQRFEIKSVPARPFSV